MSVLGTQIEVKQAGKEHWCEVVAINDLLLILHRLSDATELMLHPSFLSHTEVRALGRILLKT